MKVSSHGPQTQAMLVGHAKGRMRGCGGSRRSVYALKRHHPSVEWSLSAIDSVVTTRGQPSSREPSNLGHGSAYGGARQSECSSKGVT